MKTYSKKYQLSHRKRILHRFKKRFSFSQSVHCAIVYTCLVGGNKLPHSFINLLFAINKIENSLIYNTVRHFKLF